MGDIERDCNLALFNLQRLFRETPHKPVEKLALTLELTPDATIT